MASVHEHIDNGNGEDWITRATEAASGQGVSDKTDQRGDSWEEPLATAAPKPTGRCDTGSNLPPTLPLINKAPTDKSPKISGNGEVVSAVSAWESFPVEMLPQP